MSSPYIFWSHQLPWLTRCHCSIQAFGIIGTVGWLMKNTAITCVSQFIEVAAAQLVDVWFLFFKAIASSIPISCHWLRYHKNPEYVGKMQVFNECIQRPWSGWKVDELNETRWSFQLSKPIFTVCFVTSVVKSDHPKCRKPFSFQKNQVKHVVLKGNLPIGRFSQKQCSLKLTVRAWKWMIGNYFPFGARPIFRCFRC